MKGFVILAGLLGVSGCATLKMSTIDRVRQLDAQMLGRLRGLDKELIRLGSVRGVADRADAENDADTVRAVNAASRRAFNADDIAHAKDRGAVGEDRTGLLVVVVPNAAVELRAVVAQENEDRVTLMRHAIATHPDYSPKDMAAVRHLFALLQRASSAPEHLLRDVDGTFRRRAQIGTMAAEAK